MSGNSLLANVCIALYPTLNIFLLTYLLTLNPHGERALTKMSVKGFHKTFCNICTVQLYIISRNRFEHVKVDTYRSL